MSLQDLYADIAAAVTAYVDADQTAPAGTALEAALRTHLTAFLQDQNAIGAPLDSPSPADTLASSAFTAVTDYLSGSSDAAAVIADIRAAISTYIPVAPPVVAPPVGGSNSQLVRDLGVDAWDQVLEPAGLTGTLWIPNDQLDDLNSPVAHGGSGRVPMSTFAPPSTVLTPYDVGLLGRGIDEADLVPASSVIGSFGTESSNKYEIEVAGATLSGIRFDKRVFVRAHNVSILDCLLEEELELDRNGSANGNVPWENLLIADTRLRVAYRTDVAARFWGRARMHRCAFSGGADMIKGYQGLTVTDSVIWGGTHETGAHADLFQTQSGSNYFVDRCTMISPYGVGNAAFYVDADGPISNFALTNSYLSGGAEVPVRTTGQMSNGSVTNNIFEKIPGESQPPWINSPDGGGTTASYTGNQYWNPLTPALESIAGQ